MIPKMAFHSSSVPNMTLEVRIPDMLFGMPLQVHEPTVDTYHEPLQIDEYGFITMSPEEIHEHANKIARARKNSAGVGKASVCKCLCRYLPHKQSGRCVSFRKTGNYWCSNCCCVMKCLRCRCCGRKGRAEPRSRNRDNEKRID